MPGPSLRVPETFPRNRTRLMRSEIVGKDRQIHEGDTVTQTSFETRFGRRMKVREIVALTNTSEATIYRHYQHYGGIRIGRKILFFEQKLIEALEGLYASQKDNQREGGLEGANSAPGWKEEGKNLRNEKGSAGMGGENTKGHHIRLESRHGLW